jgi:CheY-like chemotaxis protein
MMPPVKTVLYLEDDPDDVFFFRRALQHAGVQCQVQAVSTLAEAKSYLSGDEPYNDRDRFPVPALLVTDLTICGPQESSIQLVKWVRSVPKLASVPVICTSGNDQPDTIRDFAMLGVTCHLKTSDMSEIAGAVKNALAET